MDQFIRDPKRPNKYEYMNENNDHGDHAPFDVKQTAHKIAEKTQRAFQMPLNHLVTHPKDERLIDDDSPHSSNMVQDNNGVLNESYQFNKKARLEDKSEGRVRSNSPVIGEKRRRNKTHPPNSSNTRPLSQQPNAKTNNSHNYQDPLAVHIRRNPTTSNPNRPQHKSAPVSANLSYDGNTQDRFISYPNTDQIGDTMNPMFGRNRGDSLLTVDTRKLPKKGDYLSFHDVVYKIRTRKYMWSKPQTKVILNHVNGIMMPGVNAIMGPTGSGKSSILDVLAGRKDPQYLDGKVLINGLTQPKNFKCMSGYVVQDDIVMGTLTVKENLMFSAALRLPQKYSKEQKESMVVNIIEELGLTSVTHSKIGTELLRGVSGGERKRTNIGMELITDPKVLFLDEPTTGLDAFTAASVVKTLQRLSRKGKTIILSIHQPKYSIYKLFDRYTLMAKGKIVYHGKAGSAPINYFHNLGYYIEPHNNPADFYIDVINGEIKNDKELLDQQRLESSGEYSDVRNLGRSKSNLKAKNSIVEKLVNDWQESSNRKELRNQLQTYDVIPEDDMSNEGESHSKDPSSSNGSTKFCCFQTHSGVQYATTWFNQLNWVCWRTAMNLLRNPQTSSIQLGVYLFFAFSMGIVYFDMKKTSVGFQDRYGLFFFSALQVMFVNLGAIEVFIKERPIFIHENSSGYYRVSSYFIAKLLCDMIPIKVFPAILFLPITYFMAKLKTEAGAFFFFELILLLTTAAGCSIAFFTSATFSVFGLANVVTPIIYVFMMVFSGYLITIDSIFPWLNWCRYLSAFRYSLSGLSIMEMKNMVFCNAVNTTVCQTGESFLNSNGINHTTDWDLWVNPFGLTCITVVFLALCYVQLRRINKYK